MIFDRFKAEKSVQQKDRLYTLYLKVKCNYKREVDAAKKLATVELIEHFTNKYKAVWTIVNGQGRKLKLSMIV